jgi:hypothetical protein
MPDQLPRLRPRSHISRASNENGIYHAHWGGTDDHRNVGRGDTTKGLVHVTPSLLDWLLQVLVLDLKRPPRDSALAEVNRI